MYTVRWKRWWKNCRCESENFFRTVDENVWKMTEKVWRFCRRTVPKEMRKKMSIQTLYDKKKMSAAQLAGQVQSGWSCAMDIAAAIPVSIMDALGKRAAKQEIENVQLHSLLDLQPLGILTPEAAGGITPVSWFSGGGLRRAVNEGRADIMPCYYRDMPQLFEAYVDLDAVFLHVSPMDRHGYFSMGVVGSNCEAFLKKAKRIYLEVNRNVPRALYSPMVHISQVTALCESDVPLPVMPPAVIDEVSRKIGDFIAEEVPDGATLQLGIGAVPDAVGLALKDKRDLGIHTELFTDSMVELIECGAVTNMRKPLYQGKTVATLAFGSKRMYDFINDNPAFVLLPVNEVNDPAVIARHPDFISVNAALEVDFFGQVCAESIGTRHVSGTGGQADYVRGATQSEGGKSFIAFPSTAKNGSVSRIRPTLTPGSIVTTSKNDVDYIVTEYGMAKLRGKTLSQRAKALISIAHPDFRDELVFAVKKQNVL